MPINTEIEDKKTKFNLNNKNILLHSSITFPFYPDLGKNLDLGTKNANLDFGGGGYSATSDLDLGKKFEIWIPGGGVFCNFGFGLREKVGNLDLGGGGILQLQIST